MCTTNVQTSRWSAKQIMLDLLAFAIRFLSGVTVKWAGCGPGDAQRIYFANHSSHLDFPIIWAALPDSLRAHAVAVAAADYWSCGSLRRWLVSRIFQVALVDRLKVTRASNPISGLNELIELGNSLIIFPEGGRAQEGEIKAFKSGLYHLSKAHPQIELVPVHLSNMQRILPKGEIMPVPLPCTITFGSPIKVRHDENRRDFLLRAQEAVLKCAS
jgi:1-acyl-sn-glycerol-3-phosphate acyltransferase